MKEGILNKYDFASRSIGLTGLLRNENIIEVRHEYMATEEDLDNLKSYFEWFFDASIGDVRSCRSATKEAKENYGNYITLFRTTK